MKYILAVLSTLFIYKQINAQSYTPFEGVLIYTVEAKPANNDTAQYQFFYNMPIFIKDSLIRQDSYSEGFGKQITIKNIKRSKLYLLLEFENEYFALQNKFDSTQRAFNTYKLTKKKQKFVGLKAHKVEVSNPQETDSKQIIYIYKGLSAIYNPVFDKLAGLPVQYQIENDGTILRYTLSTFEKRSLDPEMFYIPSKYQKVTFEQFIDKKPKN